MSNADGDYAVRPGRREDAPEAARLWMQSAEEHTEYDEVYRTSPQAERTMRRFLADLASGGHAFLLVAVEPDEGGVIGFLSGELREGSPTFSPKTWASVDDIYVAPEHRSRGVGRELVRRCREWAADRGADGVSLQVAAGNERARKLYRELGFREVSVYAVSEL
ncbi:GNAT family N-acetyltransferase [Rubrobacter aplysinae]|uniref:GNAT family N-acetyltransferase n=1 Tax=Rubrobacter aplysinae TaxID=909625 RepID=UPI00069D60AA|nr:GNAT family N-acetyltransferase [Rubrobacter aplysinae]